MKKACFSFPEQYANPGGKNNFTISPQPRAKSSQNNSPDARSRGLRDSRLGSFLLNLSRTGRTPQAHLERSDPNPSQRKMNFTISPCSALISGQDDTRFKSPHFLPPGRSHKKAVFWPFSDCSPSRFPLGMRRIGFSCTGCGQNYVLFDAPPHPRRIWRPFIQLPSKLFT